MSAEEAAAVPTLPKRPARVVIEPGEWRPVAERIVRDTIAKHPNWNAPADRVPPGGTNWPAYNFIKELGMLVPWFDPSSEPPEDYTKGTAEWRRENEEFKTIWYQECSRQMNLGQVSTPGPRTELPTTPSTPAPPVLSPELPPVRKTSRQLSLF